MSKFIQLTGVSMFIIMMNTSAGGIAVVMEYQKGS
jgi:hypothetical protein